MVEIMVFRTIEVTTSALAGVRAYILDHSSDECFRTFFRVKTGENMSYFVFLAEFFKGITVSKPVGTVLRWSGNWIITDSEGD